MAIILDGTTGITTPGGDASAVSYTTPIVKSPSSLTFQTNGSTTAVTINASQNVGMGTSSPAVHLDVVSPNNGATAWAWFHGNTGGATPSASINSGIMLGGNYSAGNSESNIMWGTGYNSATQYLSFSTWNNSTSTVSEKMRIDSSGNLLVGCTTTPSAGGYGAAFQSGSSVAGNMTLTFRANTTSAYEPVYFYNPNGLVGYIRTSASTTTYSTSSDYRLKENIAPMTGALATVAQLKPVTYKWKVDGSDGQGFIAHELQAVVPDCVSGEKDAVDADGNPKYQGIDTSFLVATLTAAIQEQQEIINELKSRIETLESK